MGLELRDSTFDFSRFESGFNGLLANLGSSIFDLVELIRFMYLGLSEFEDGPVQSIWIQSTSILYLLIY